jgi:DMSO/TMAO reductase YedYZ molybdopterin-dependent catalytic subunit
MRTYGEGAGLTMMDKHESNSTIGRRAFLGVAAAIPLLGTRAGVRAEDSDLHGPGLVLRQSEPRNLEGPFSSLDGFITPNDRFYVRSHFPVPKVDAATWTLKVEGAVETPFEIGQDELRRLPSKTMTAMIECAGNGRVFLVPRANGLLWENGAVGNAEWTGVPLATILERAGVKSGAVDVVLEGADKGKIDTDPKTPGVIQYARSVPLAKAIGDVLLVYKMNGEDLTQLHGAPVRAIVPGWYGMASVKWLTRILVTERAFGGYFQTFDYSTFDRVHGQASLVPLGENGLKSQIARPARMETVAKGKPYRVRGAAWAGEAGVAGVDLSVDGGKTWNKAELIGDPVKFAWRLWQWTWQVPDAPGKQTLMARATSDRGAVQPMTRDEDLRTVKIHHVIPVEVDVA